MPDLISVFTKWWKFIIGLSLVAVIVAFIAATLSPKKYLSSTTALPANSLTADKARIFNANIEALYPEIGLPDELDKLEGTAALDTLFIATVEEFNLVPHYKIEASDEATYKAALKLKRNSRISRTGYGELKIKVWDEERNMAAALANRLLDNLQQIHQHLQNENSSLILKKIKEGYILKLQEYKQVNDTIKKLASIEANIAEMHNNALLSQLQEYKKIIGEYELAVSLNPQVLLTVENARPSLWPDKPRILEIVLFTLAAAIGTSLLLALIMERQKK